MAEDKEYGEWQKRIRDAENAVAIQSENWEAYYKLFRGILDSDEEEQSLKADVHIPIIGPMIHTFTARELMSFFGNPESVSVEIAGKGNDDKMREIERRVRKGLHFLWSEPGVFEPLYTAITDKNVFGNVMLKVMPAYDFEGNINKTKIFETEIIDLVNSLFDPNANKWEKVEWVGFRKIVSWQYLETHYGKEKAYKKIKDKITEKKNNLFGINTHNRKVLPEGVELTEIWDRVNEEVLYFVDRKYLIKELDKFPYSFPFILGKCFPESNTVWSYGIADVLKWIQLHADELACLRLDDLVRNVHTKWAVTSDTEEQMAITGPGDLIRVTDMNNIPKALSAADVTQSLGQEVEIDRELAYSVMGVSPWTQVNIPTKRMTTPEVALSERGSGRAWTVMKSSEDTLWLPWAEQVLSLTLQFAPEDFYDKICGEISATVAPEKYEKFGYITPKSIKKEGIHAQIQAKMAYNILQEEQKMLGIAQFIRIVGSIAPAYLRAGYSLRLLGETLNIPGIEKIIKSDEELKAEKEALMQQLAQNQVQAGAQSLAGGGGRTSLFNEGG